MVVLRGRVVAGVDSGRWRAVVELVASAIRGSVVATWLLGVTNEVGEVVAADRTADDEAAADVGTGVVVAVARPPALAVAAVGCGALNGENSTESAGWVAEPSTPGSSLAAAATAVGAPLTSAVTSGVWVVVAAVVERSVDPMVGWTNGTTGTVDAGGATTPIGRAATGSVSRPEGWN